MKCPHCGSADVQRARIANDCWRCMRCDLAGPLHVLKALAEPRAVDHEHVMVEAERLLRERSVYEVAFTEATFSGPDKRTYLEVKPSVGRSFMGATLVEAWRKLTGKGG